MRIIPVLDLRQGIVVRGIAGLRNEYRPIHTQLTSSARPLDVANAFAERFGLRELYVADLDAIAGAEPSFGVYQALRLHGFRLWVDAGISGAESAAPIAATGVERLVVALETVDGPETLESLSNYYGGDRVRFSLDLKSGIPIGKQSAWKVRDAAGIAGQAIACGAGGVIVLDLSQVGTNTGTGTESLCRELAAAHPKTEIIAGGGVRDVTDLFGLVQLGVHGVLVASALHDGRVTSNDLLMLRNGDSAS